MFRNISVLKIILTLYLLLYFFTLVYMYFLTNYIPSLHKYDFISGNELLIKLK